MKIFSKRIDPTDPSFRAGRRECVDVLLEAGAAADAEDEAGWTPLHIAVSAGHLEVVLSLLAASLMKVTSLWTSATSRMKALAAAAVARPLFMFSYPMVRSPRQACCSAPSRYLWC